VIAYKVEKLTSGVIERAPGSLGPKGEGIGFPAPITRDGPGWRADVDLPHGVTATDVMGRRDGCRRAARTLGVPHPQLPDPP
jgi:DNA segregation ATPase FtsK/SpoIIIE, S-DNA-T family